MDTRAVTHYKPPSRLSLPSPLLPPEHLPAPPRPLRRPAPSGATAGGLVPVCVPGSRGSGWGEILLRLSEGPRRAPTNWIRDLRTASRRAGWTLATRDTVLAGVRPEASAESPERPGEPFGTTPLVSLDREPLAEVFSCRMRPGHPAPNPSVPPIGLQRELDWGPEGGRGEISRGT